MTGLVNQSSPTRPSHHISFDVNRYFSKRLLSELKSLIDKRNINENTLNQLMRQHQITVRQRFGPLCIENLLGYFGVAPNIFKRNPGSMTVGYALGRHENTVNLLLAKYPKLRFFAIVGYAIGGHEKHVNTVLVKHPHLRKFAF